MSAPDTCRLCHVTLDPDEHGYCTDCKWDLDCEWRDWGFPR